MAVSYIGSVAGTTSATLPTHAAGDWILAFAFRDGSTTAPTLPAGWTSLGTSGANTCSARVGAIQATAPGTSSGTWTNATTVEFMIYRGAQGFGTPVFATGSSTTVSYPALTLTDADGSSWVAGMAGHRSVNTSLETPPTGMTNRITSVDATDEIAGHDTNGGVTSWTLQTVAVGGTASGWIGSTVEIIEEPPPPTSSLSFVAARGETYVSGGSFSFALPAGIADGDVTWLYLGNSGTSGYETPPTGWDLVTAGGTDARLLTGMSQAVYRRVRVSGDPDTISLSPGGGSNDRQAAAIVLRGCAATAAAVTINGNGFANGVGSQSVAVPQGGGIISFSCIGGDGRTWNEPAGMTEPSGILASANFSSVSGAYQLPLNANTYSKSSTWSAGGPLGTVLIAVDQAGGGGINGDGSGTLTITGAADGSVTVTGNGAGNLSIAGSGDGSILIQSDGSGVLTITGSGDGIVLAPRTGDGAGELTITGSADGSILIQADGSGAFTVTGSGDGIVITAVTGDGAGTLTITGSGDGVVPIAADGAGTYTVTGLADGSVSIIANGAGDCTASGSGAGVVTDTRTGDGAGVLTISGSGDGTVADAVFRTLKMRPDGRIEAVVGTPGPGELQMLSSGRLAFIGT